MKSLRAPVMALRFLVTHSRLLVLGGDVVPGVPVEDHIGEFIVCQLTVREAAALPLPAPKPGVREGPLGAPPCVAPPLRRMAWRPELRPRLLGLPTTSVSVVAKPVLAALRAASGAEA